MSDTEIRITITKFFNEKPMLQGIAVDQDFFELGASSLTVVDLQIQIEEALKKEVDTSKLMANPTLDGWVSAYSEI
jgi:acyl carrier protein